MSDAPPFLTSMVDRTIGQPKIVVVFVDEIEAATEKVSEDPPINSCLSLEQTSIKEEKTTSRVAIDINNLRQRNNQKRNSSIITHNAYTYYVTSENKLYCSNPEHTTNNVRGCSKLFEVIRGCWINTNRPDVRTAQEVTICLSPWVHFRKSFFPTLFPRLTI